MDDDVLELDEEEWVPVPIDSLTVKELKDELGSRGLRKGGTRDILIDRLVDALNGTKAAAASSRCEPQHAGSREGVPVQVQFLQGLVPLQQL